MKLCNAKYMLQSPVCTWNNFISALYPMKCLLLVTEVLLLGWQLLILSFPPQRIISGYLNWLRVPELHIIIYCFLYVGCCCWESFVIQEGEVWSVHVASGMLCIIWMLSTLHLATSLNNRTEELAKMNSYIWRVGGK